MCDPTAGRDLKTCVARLNVAIAALLFPGSIFRAVMGPSVKGLTAVPQVPAMMNGKIHWTEQLGNAFPRHMTTSWTPSSAPGNADAPDT